MYRRRVRERTLVKHIPHIIQTRSMSPKRGFYGELLILVHLPRHYRKLLQHGVSNSYLHLRIRRLERVVGNYDGHGQSLIATNVFSVGLAVGYAKTTKIINPRALVLSVPGGRQFLDEEGVRRGPCRFLAQMVFYL
ncbi:unnamed protein product [Ectocarpus sp. CCAP 1310/34]|nr:unnamed protein product [Ectocarpus sp. CCAP 1310/34]